MVMYFIGSFVGEGYCKNVVGWYVVDFIELGDVVDKYVGFVGIGIGKY